MIITAGMQGQIEGDTVTVFAPPDAAIPTEALSDPAVAAEYVDAHVADGAFDVAALGAAGQVQMRDGEIWMVSGTTLTSSTDGSVSATITTPDQLASNGFVQGISASLFVAVPDTTSSTTQPPTGS